MLQKNSFNDTAYDILGMLLGIFVFIPNKVKPYLVVLVILFSFFSNLRGKRLQDLLKDVLPLAVLFLCYSISLINSDDIKAGLVLLGRLTPLILLPLALFVIEKNRRRQIFSRFQFFFILSLSLYAVSIFIYLNSLGCFSGDSSLSYGYSYITNEFYGLNDHPIYISSYFSVGLLMLMYSRYKSKTATILAFLIIFSGLILLSRKGSIIAFSICAIVYFLSKRKQIIKALVFLVIVAVAVMYFSEIRNRFSELVEKDKIEKNQETSTGIRTIVWENAFHLTFNNNFMGYGVGDVQTILNKHYSELGFEKMAEGNYNAHNQFFQTGLTIGVFGLILFIISLIYLFSRFILKKNKKGMTILLYFIFIFLTESYLERQNGIIFFSLIISMFIFADDEKNNSDNWAVSTSDIRGKYS